MLIRLVDTIILQKVCKQYKLLDSLTCQVEEHAEIVTCLILFWCSNKLAIEILLEKVFRHSRPSYYLVRRIKNEAE